VPFFYARCTAFHDARKEKEAWEVEERQALLLADKRISARKSRRSNTTATKRNLRCELSAAS
jgi:hypothetical protein